MKYIFYKEFIKLKLPIIVVFTVNIAVNIYSFFRIRVGFVMQEPTMIWFDIIQKNAFFYDRISMPLIISAFSIGILQFYVEKDKKRFRISCHLPINEVAMITYMQLFGLFVVTLLWIVDFIGVFIISYAFFPDDLVNSIINVFIYKLFLAIVVYMIAATVALEYSWIKKIQILLLTGGVVYFYPVAVYIPSIINTLLCLLITIVALFSIYYPALGYRAGGK